MLEEFIKYLKEQVQNRSIYVWGGQGQDYTVISESWIRKQETSELNAVRSINHWKRQVQAGYEKKLRAFDCSGLGMYFLYNLHRLIGRDLTSNGMLGECEIIERTGLRKGDWVFRVYASGKDKGRAYHIGYVVDDALNVIEGQGRNYGVVQRPLNAAGTGYWNAFGRPRVFKKEIEAGAFIFTRMLRYKTPFMRGEDVRELQRLLAKAGHNPGPIDGIFGPRTLSAVRTFQKAKKLVVDGIAGPKTTVALGGIWKG